MRFRTLLIILLVICMPWFINAYKLSQCDFESNYKCEAIHAIGVFIPPASFVTVWFGSDK